MEHGLTPIAEACPAVHIFDRPTLFLDALGLPFRRDAADLEACLRACGPVNAVFGHADVVRPPVRAQRGSVGLVAEGVWHAGGQTTVLQVHHVQVLGYHSCME